MDLKILCFLLILFSFKYGSSQLYFCKKDKTFLIDKQEELSFIYENRAHISTYKRDSTHCFHWSFQRKYPNRFQLDSFLIEYQFIEVGKKIPNDSIEFVITHVDSTEDYVLPCGNADEPDWKQMYHFQFDLSYKGQVIHSGKGYSSGFQTDFAHQLRGIYWEFDKYTYVWKSTRSDDFYVHTMDGFHRPKKPKDK